MPGGRRPNASSVGASSVYGPGRTAMPPASRPGPGGAARCGWERRQRGGDRRGRGGRGLGRGRCGGRLPGAVAAGAVVAGAVFGWAGAACCAWAGSANAVATVSASKVGYRILLSGAVENISYHRPSRQWVPLATTRALAGMERADQGIRGARKPLVSSSTPFGRTISSVTKAWSPSALVRRRHVAGQRHDHRLAREGREFGGAATGRHAATQFGPVDRALDQMIIDQPHQHA